MTRGRRRIWKFYFTPDSIFQIPYSLSLMDTISPLIFQIIVLIFSAVIHEVSHGAMAYRLGDPTAKQLGRLTLNPFKHLDPMGSFVVPVLLYMLRSPFVFGWAKPVPFDTRFLKNPKTGSGLIALAGPASNVVIALAFGLFSRFSAASGDEFVLTLIPLFHLIIILNLVLAVFNLIPIPQIDGSKILFALLPYSAYAVQGFLERYGLFLVIFVILWGGRIIFPIVDFLFTLFVGTSY